MGLFNMVLEGVLNEIRAEDAYNRFYSSIPKEDFIKITGGEENIDKFIQFFLNCVRDGKSTVDEVVEAITAYKSADQLIKQKIKNKVSSGEYEDAAEVTYDVKYFSSGGAVLSRKKFAKEGYIKLGENERWICTCTTNYCANNHYFGSSHWCTASDRMGRYDGYRYFKSYGPASNCALIQFRWKGQVEPYNGETSYTDMPPAESFDKELGFTGDTIPQRYSMFQLQIRDNMDERQICDWADVSCTSDIVKMFVSNKLFECIDKEKIDFCVKKGQEQLEVEEKYQDAIYRLLELRKEKRRKMLEAKRNRFYDECEEYTRNKKQHIGEKWNEFLQEKMYDDINIIRFMVERDLRNSIPISGDEVFAKTNYTKIWNHVNIFGDTFALTIGPTLGMIKDVRGCNTANGEVDCEIFERMSDSMGVRKSIVVFITSVGEDGEPWGLADTPTKGPFDGKAYVTLISSVGVNSLSTGRFYDISTSNNETVTVFDSKNPNVSFEVEFFPSVFCYGKNKYIFFDENEQCDPNYVIYNEADGSAAPKSDADPDISIPNVGKALIFTKEDWDYQVIGLNDESGNFSAQKVNVSNSLIVGIQNLGYDNHHYLKLEFDIGRYNLLEQPSGELVFGVFGESVWVERDNSCFMRVDAEDLPFRKKGMGFRRNGYYDRQCVLVRKPDGTYKMWELIYGSNEGPKEEKCDKYGRTEKDLIGDKNFKAWLAAGGHSPEAKAQMDKMWADRRGDTEDDSGSKAMAAWNDDDRGLDSRVPGTWAANTFKIDTKDKSNTLWDYTDFADKPKDDWRGYMDVIDPTMAQRDEGSPEKRRGLFYRIGKNGKPLDQPWYSEDEVPAKLSDRPVRNGKIYENYKSLISLMNRMGLLED